MEKLNCWEYKQCGHEGTGDIFEEVGTCPTSTEICTDGVNDGKNGGRACWAIAGSLSNSEIKCYCMSKIDNCMRCDFYALVKKEEAEKFMTGSEITEIVMYQEKFYL
jgi:hypothetical protein